jgi:hypothetical protein
LDSLCQSWAGRHDRRRGFATFHNSKNKLSIVKLPEVAFSGEPQNTCERVRWPSGARELSDGRCALIVRMFENCCATRLDAAANAVRCAAQIS